MLPELLEMDVKGNIGGVRELIADYIVNVKNGCSFRRLTITGRSPGIPGMRKIIIRQWNW